MHPIAYFATGLFVAISPVIRANELSGIFPSGTELIYSGTATNSGVPSQENRKIVFTTSTDTLNGVYEYTTTGTGTGLLRHASRFESGTYSETEVSRIELSFGTDTTGTYTSSGSYSGQDASGSFSGTFTSSGNFQLRFPDVSRAPEVLDDFNDNSKDISHWGADLGSTGARFEETNRRLEFRASGTGFEEKLRPLVMGKPRYGKNWEVTVDLSNRFTPQTDIPQAAIGLRIVSPGNPADFVETALLAYREGAATANPAYSLLGNGNEKFALIRSNFAALQVQFDSVRKLLHCDYDADGAVNGYSWTRFATYGISGSAGHTDDADWGISDGAQEFGIFLYSYRVGGSDSDGVVSLDDFRSSEGRGIATETLDEWLVRNYGSTDVPEAALDFDGDLDGLSNLAEYAYGTAPESFGAVGAPGYVGGAPSVGTAPTGDFPRLEIIYTRRKFGLAPGFSYQPQFSSTLSEIWENATAPEMVSDLGGGFERVTVIDHVPGSPLLRFGRVRVSTGGN